MVAGRAHARKLPARARLLESRLQVELPEPVLGGPVERMDQIYFGHREVEEVEAEARAGAVDRGPVAACETRTILAGPRHARVAEDGPVEREHPVVARPD